jgi:predicted TPR repeat methyltransferase
MTLDTSSQQTAQAIEHALHQAVIQHQAGQMELAEKLYRAILQIEPQHPEANHNLGVLSVQLKQPAAGLPHFMVALEADPTRGQYWLSCIDALYQAGQMEDARQMLALARQQGLEGEEIKALALLLEGGAGATEPAHAGHQSAAKKPKPGKPDEQATHKGKEPTAQERNLIVSMFNEGRYAEVATLARSLTERFPQNGFGWNLLGAVLKQMGRPADALLPMQKAAALSPGDSNVHCNLGAMLQDMGRSAEAEVSLKRALQINPSNAEALCNMGYTQQSLGRPDEATASYRRALQIKPDFAVAHCNLGMTLHNQGRLAEAEASYRKALQLTPDFAEAHCNLGITLQSLGRTEAESSFRQALQIKPDYVDAHSGLGVFLQETGRLDEALVHFRECARLSPGNVVAQHLIASLTGQSTERAPDQYVEKVFDNYADRFDTHLQQVLQYDIPKKLVPLIAAHLPVAAKCNVLDLGCGTGLIGSEIASYSKQLVGVDLSAKMLDKARTRNLYQRLERSDLLGMMQGEPASSYDLVIATDVFIYVGKLDEVIREIKRLLSAGSIFAFSIETCEAEAAGPGYQLEHTGRYAHTVEYLSRLAATNGFRILEMVATQIRTEHGKPVNGHMAVWQG